MSVKGMSTALEKNAAKEKEKFTETKIKIEYTKLTELKLNPKNPRDNDLAVDDVMVSIKEFGFINPILVDENLMIIAGHTRFKAALKLGMKQVPCVNITHLTPAQAKAYMVADNKLNEKAKWNRDLLGEILNEMPQTLNLDFLFTDSEIDKILGVKKEEMQQQQDDQEEYFNEMSDNDHDKKQQEMVNIVNKGDENEAWVDMPEFKKGENPIQCNIVFEKEEDRDSFVAEKLANFKSKKMSNTVIVYYGKE